MMGLPEVAFHTGLSTPQDGPLGRFLPPLPPGMVTAWLSQNRHPGACILDPFGASPEAVLETARAGFGVLTCMNNPVLRFILEIKAAGYPAASYRSTLADLAAFRKGDERLEKHLTRLYETQCQACQKTVQAKAFLWNKGADNPYARVYACPCGDDGEYPVTPDDLRRLAGLPPSGLHRARAVERVAPPDDPARPDVEEALGMYLARPLYILLSLISALDSLPANSEKRQQMAALILPILDEGTSMWGHPAARHRPRQLFIPGQFREANLWLSLEKAGEDWADEKPPVRLVTWPQEPAPGEICIYPGRAKDLAANPPGWQLDTCMATIPRPNQAFWTLSAVWAGWLWGREAVHPLKGALTRHRYDYSWHSQALASVFTSLPQLLPPGAHIQALVLEAETPYLSAVILAAEQAHFELVSLAVRADSEQAQVDWVARALKPSSGTLLEFAFRAGATRTLQARGEPSEYLAVGAGALGEAAHQHTFQPEAASSSGEHFTSTTNSLRRVFSDKATFIHFGGSDQSPEAGSWWLRDIGEVQVSLSDRVEAAVYKLLQEAAPVSLPTVDQEICRQFGGLLTPPTSLVQACLASYALPIDEAANLYRLRPEDKLNSREMEINYLKGLLCQAGARLGYKAIRQETVAWKAPDGELNCQFVLQWSAETDATIFDPKFEPTRSIIVLPGGRANLLAYKLAQNPRLDQAVKKGWRFLKFRHLRALAANPLLDRKMWESQLEMDPPEEKASAMTLF